MTVNSIVIPMHNGGGLIRQQLEALSSALGGCPDTEIIVVDNRSTDDGPALVAAWSAGSGVPVRVVPAHEKVGEPFARNVGWVAARSDRILFCDADDVVGAQWIAALSASLVANQYVTGPLDTKLLNDPRIVNLRGQRLFTELPTLDGGIPFAHGCNMGFRRSVLEKLGGFDETFLIACDIEIAIRAWQQGIHLGWAPEALVHYRLRPTVGEVYKQARAYGRSRRRISGILPGGSTRIDWKRQTLRTAWLVRNLPSTRTFGGRMDWAWVAGQVSGELGNRVSWRR